MSIDRRLLRKLAGAAGAVAGLGVAVAAGIGAANAGPTAAPGLPPAKSARLEQEQRQIRHLPAGRKTSPSGLTAATTASAFAGLTPGIVDRHQGPFPAALFTVGNMYRLPIGDHWDFAFAGSDPARNGRSAVRVYQMAADGTYTSVGEYLSPIQAGTLSVTGGSGTTLTLKAGARTETFDVATLTFG